MGYLKDEYKIQKVIRIIKNSINEPTTTIRLETHNKSSYEDVLSKGIVIGATFFRAVEWKFKENVKQCYNCQKLGHYKANCGDKTSTCLRCSQKHDHHYSKCENPLK